MVQVNDMRYKTTQVSDVPKYRLEIKQDDYADNPREAYDNFGKMICWHRRYDLGDKHGFEEPRDFLKQCVSFTLSADEVIDYIKDEKVDDVRLMYDRSNHEWLLQDKYDDKWFTENTFWEDILNGSEIIKECILDIIPINALKELADRKNIMLPLYLYDHSGLSISCSHGYPYNDRWDAGQVGWIYISHDEVQRAYGEVTPETIAKAEQCMETEVSQYDSYLRGDCYGCIIEKDGEEVYSSWGYIGDLREMIEEMRSNADEEYKHLFDHVDYCCTEYSEYEPDEADKDEKTVIQGYEVIDRKRVGSHEFVLAHNPNAPEPYVTWKCKTGTNDMYHGHYFTDKLRAERDFKRRINEERSYDR